MASKGKKIKNPDLSPNGAKSKRLRIEYCLPGT